MHIQKQHWEKLSATVIKQLRERNMEGYYFKTKEEARMYIISNLVPYSSISWGGSMTLHQIGILSALHTCQEFHLIDRSAVDPDDVEDVYHKAFSADYYLMSSNAITLDGKLVNIDGTGNRVAALIYGPRTVYVIAGMNKIVTDVDEALKRIHNVTCPQNSIRLNKNTPCANTGKCTDCLCSDCICMQTVITRNSRQPGRIKVILIGEELGY